MVLPVGLEHVGVIMDGNGRWAESRGLARIEGHIQGVQVSKHIIEAASVLGLRFLSLYVFSVENWKRPEEEVDSLMGILKSHLRNELDFYRKNQIRIWHSGDLSGLARDIRAELLYTIEATKKMQGLTVNLLINYGGQQEIVLAARDLIVKNISVDRKNFQQLLSCGNPLPYVDLLIRTGGEKRISNFLLWDIAYAELFFDDKLWPEWSVDDFYRALYDFSRRKRRFGKVNKVGGD